MRMASLVRYMFVLTLLAALLVGGTFVRCSFVVPSTPVAMQNHIFTLSCLGGNFAILLLFLAALRWRWLLMSIGPAAIETLGIMLMIFSMLVVVLSMPVYLVYMRQLNIKDVHGDKFYASDSRAILMIQVIISATHLGLPARWFVMLPMEAAGIMLYASLIYVIGSPEPIIHASMNLALLTGVICAFAMGKRVDEIRERRAFLQLAEERSKRCEVEFELWQTKDEQKHPDAPSETLESTVPTAAPSDQIFLRVEGDTSGVEAQLARVAAYCDSEHWRIQREELTMLKSDLLGQGGFGVVARGVFCGMMVAVKLPKPLKDDDDVHVEGLCNELRVLRYLRHPNIVTTHGAIIEPENGQLALVMELVKGTVLTDFLRRKAENKHPSPTNLLERYQVMLGVCRALFYMHTRSPHIVHGDLKASNVMVEQQNSHVQPKLLDFGLSRVLTRKAKPLGGTLAWVAPEVLQGGRTPKCSADVYSLGRLLAFAATSIPPLAGHNPSKLKRAFRYNKLPLPIWPNGCAFEITCKPLVHACLASDESQRPSMAMVHDRLLEVPSKMGLEDAGCGFLEDVKDMVTKIRSLSPSSENSGWAMPLPVEKVQQEHQSGSHLPSLPEESGLPSLPDVDEAGSSTCSPAESLASCSSRSARTRRETCEMALEGSLWNALCRWSWTKPPDACCEEHARIAKAREICNTVLARECIHAPLPPMGTQCKSCGIMGVGDQCDLCGCTSRIDFAEV